MPKIIAWLLSIFLTLCPWCCMASSVTTTPTTFTSVAADDDREWSSPGNASASDNTYTTASVQDANETDHLQGVGGIIVPGGAKIVGLEVLIEANSTVQDDSAEFKEVLLVINGIIQPVNRAAGENLKLADAIFTFGSPTDSWGTTLTRDIVTAPDFGAAVQMKGLIAGIPEARVDHMQIVVYFSNPMAGQVSVPGAIAGQVFTAHAIAGQIQTAGATAGQVN